MQMLQRFGIAKCDQGLLPSTDSRHAGCLAVCCAFLPPSSVCSRVPALLPTVTHQLALNPYAAMALGSRSGRRRRCCCCGYHSTLAAPQTAASAAHDLPAAASAAAHPAPSACAATVQGDTLVALSQSAQQQDKLLQTGEVTSCCPDTQQAVATQCTTASEQDALTLRLACSAALPFSSPSSRPRCCRCCSASPSARS